MGSADCQLPEKTACCLYVQGTCLYIHSDHYVLRYKAGSEGRIVERALQGQSTQPVLAPDLVYCLRGGKCWAFHITTGELAT